MNLTKAERTIAQASKLEVITPAKAERWLGKMKLNRGLSETRISHIQEEIADGRWEINGEAIKFDTEGNLVDGQHRLHAVLRADTPIKSLIVRGLSPETVKTMDTGKSRSPADSLKMNGYTDPNNLAAALIIIDDYINLGTLVGGRRKSPSKMLEISELHDLKLSLSLAHKGKSLLAPSRIAAMHYLASFELPDKATEFWSAFGSGANLADNHPAFALRNKFMLARMQGITMPKREALMYAVAAWNKFAMGKRCKIIRIKDIDVNTDIIGAMERS